VRVCVASVIPVLGRGNILTAVYAVAEKAADVVKVNLEGGQEMICTRSIATEVSSDFCRQRSNSRQPCSVLDSLEYPYVQPI
jgi:hypothetical protein